MFSKVLIVAWRDFKTTAMTKAFIFAIVGVPVLIVAIGAIAGLIMATHQPPPLIGSVAIVDPAGDLAAALVKAFDPKTIETEDREKAEEAIEHVSESLGQPGLRGGPGISTEGLQRGEIKVTVERVESSDDAAIAAIEERVRRGELLAAAIVPAETIAVPQPGSPRPTFTMFVSERVEASHTSLIEQRIGQAVVEVRAAREGVDLAHQRAMLERPSAATNRLLEAGGQSEETEAMREVKRFVVPMAFMMLLWISVFSTGQHLLNSTIEEKSNKVMEVLLSAVSPLELLAGKILGQGAVGLVILGVYSATGVVALAALSQAGLIPWTQLVYLGIYFFMAYFMVASLMAAVGSAVSDIREANSLLTPVMIVLIFPMVLWMPISQAPNGAIASVASFVPPAIPFVMILRLCADEAVPLWQTIASIIWGYGCVVGMVWAASKIFRVGVLMTGKPPNPIELLKWIRYS
jgi:ABC-2 type transport system permease protein